MLEIWLPWQIMSAHVNGSLQRLAKLYDPENDLIPGAPRVTHTDSVLIEAIAELASEIEDNRNQITNLENQIRDIS